MPSLGKNGEGQGAGKNRSVSAAWLCRALVVGLWAIVSRLLGLARDLAMAWLVGSGSLADALVAATVVPHAFRKLLADGVLSIPVTVAATASGVDATHPAPRGLFRAIAPWLVALSVLLCAVFFLPAGIVAELCQSFRADDAEWAATTAWLVRTASLYLGTVLFSALAMGLLHAQAAFSSASASPVCFNLVMLCFMAAAALGLGSTASLIALGFSAAGLAQVFWLYHALKRRNEILCCTLQAASGQGSASGAEALPESRQERVGNLAAFLKRGFSRLPATVLAASGMPLAVLAAMLPASIAAQGSMTALYYADRLLEFPVGIVGACMGIATLPDLSGLAARRDGKGLWENLCLALRMGLLFSLPATLGLMAIAPELVGMLLGRGAFAMDALGTVSAALIWLLPGLPACVLLRTLVAAGHALCLDGYAALLAVLGALFPLVLGLAWVGLLPGTFPLAAPVAASLVLWMQALFLFARIRKCCEAQCAEPLSASPALSLKNIARLLACALCAGGVAWIVVRSATGLGSVLCILAACALGACAWLAALRVLLQQEFCLLRVQLRKKG